jgi:hypothetical protein
MRHIGFPRMIRVPDHLHAPSSESMAINSLPLKTDPETGEVTIELRNH